MCTGSAFLHTAGAEDPGHEGEVLALFAEVHAEPRIGSPPIRDLLSPMGSPPNCALPLSPQTVLVEQGQPVSGKCLALLVSAFKCLGDT